MAELKSLSIQGVPILDIIYPIGSIYETSNSAFDPNKEFGGSWKRIKGKMLIGVDEDDTDLSESQKTGGEKTHTLTTNEMPYHDHTMKGNSHSFAWGDGNCTVNTNATAVAAKPSSNTLCTLQGSYNSVNGNGSNWAHNNMPPYYTVYVWEKVGIVA